MDSRLDVSYLGTSSLLQLCRWLWPKDQRRAPCFVTSINIVYSVATTAVHRTYRTRTLAIEQSKSPQRSSQPTSCQEGLPLRGDLLPFWPHHESVRAHRVNHLSSMSFYVVTEA